MLLSGFVSIIQIIFLPGFLLLKAFNIKTDTVIQKLLYVFAVSLFANYVLVTLLTLFRFYNHHVMWGLVTVELILLFLFFRIEILNRIRQADFQKLFIKVYIHFKKQSAAGKPVIITSALIFLFYLALFAANIGTIFYFVDSVFNYEWNSWAIDFANNRFPRFSAHFPQLIPANWSICYVMIGKTDVHFFPKAFMPLFFIGNLLMFIDLAVTKKNKLFLAAMIIYGLFAPVIYALVFIADGSADLPVSFFAFLTFYAFLKNDAQLKFGENSDIPSQLKKYLVIFSFAAMAASAKLAGFYIFVVTCFLALLILLINRKKIRRTNLFKILPAAFLIIIAALFWYFKSPEAMLSGLDQPENLPEGYSVIVTRALKLIYYNFGPPVCAFFIITIAASLCTFRDKDYPVLFREDRNSRINIPFYIISIVMVIIPVLVWMLKRSSDFRNLSFVVPFLSFASAVGLFKLIISLKSVFLKKNVPKETAEKENEESVSGGAGYTGLNSKQKIFLTTAVLFFGILAWGISSDSFYNFLLNIYLFIHKFYFRGSRIVYFIEYGFLLHIDYYQNVFAALSLILMIIPLLVLFKIRNFMIFILLTGALITLNFTIADEAAILKHQAESFDKVDARNYYDWLSMISKSTGLRKPINTNFPAILHEKIRRELKFRFIKGISESDLQSVNEKNLPLFLKLSRLERGTAEFIRSNLKNKKYKLLFSDRDLNYVFFLINPA